VRSVLVAGFVSVRVAPGTAAPLGSVIMPVISAVGTWAQTTALNKNSTTQNLDAIDMTTSFSQNFRC
jgi:hypothetical protein